MTAPEWVDKEIQQVPTVSRSSRQVALIKSRFIDIVIQIRWKFHSALIQVPVKWSLYNFVRQLCPPDVKNYVAAWYATMELHSNQFSIEFDLR